jgi:hypothetical protein
MSPIPLLVANQVRVWDNTVHILLGTNKLTDYNYELNNLHLSTFFTLIESRVECLKRHLEFGVLFCVKESGYS